MEGPLTRLRRYFAPVRIDVGLNAVWNICARVCRREKSAMQTRPYNHWKKKEWLMADAPGHAASSVCADAFRTTARTIRTAASTCTSAQYKVTKTQASPKEIRTTVRTTARTTIRPTFAAIRACTATRFKKSQVF